MRLSRTLVRLDIRPRPRPPAMVAALLSLGLVATLAGPAAAQADPPRVVVTTAVLGAVVDDLVGGTADVTVLMGNGVDPHDWSPSAQDIETVFGADLVVVNGLGLEEGLLDVIAEAESNGVPVFEATDHITVRALGEDAHAADDEAHADDEEAHDHGTEDPHFWVDPISMRDVVTALTPVLAEVGVEVDDADLTARLDALDAEVREQLASIPEGARKLVTGHESMGYFADRYGFQLVGAVIPGLSSQGEVSAGELAQLAQLIETEGVAVIFTEIGTPRSVVDAIAAETGAAVVELPSHTLPDDGSYVSFIRGISGAIAGALS